MTGASPDFSLDRADGGSTLSARGTLSFATAARALDAIGRALEDATLSTLDLAKVTHGDSAGIACLLATRAAAQARGRSLAFAHVPDGMRTLARVCGAERLID